MAGHTNANIINAVANGQILCTNCNALNEADSRFCMACGTPLCQVVKNAEIEEDSETQAFKQTEVKPEMPFEPVPQTEDVATMEERERTEIPFVETEITKKTVNETESVENVTLPFASVTNNTSGMTTVFPSVHSTTEETHHTSPFQPALHEINKEEVMDAVGVFAEGLPDWDIVPPQVLLRRKAK